MRIFAFILLLLHVNFFLFISQADEQDVYEAHGRKVRDIDSLMDWLRQAPAKEKNTGSHNENKNDRNSRFFHILKQHFFSPPAVRIKKPAGPPNEPRRPVLNDTPLFAGFFSIQAPPPKA